MLPKSASASKSAPTQTAVFSVKQARWVCGVLAMLIGVVGKESLLGIILGQARGEIVSLVRSEESGKGPSADPWFTGN
jgi:hypothetical protein